jgi:hypothetical protein
VQSFKHSQSQHNIEVISELHAAAGQVPLSEGPNRVDVSPPPLHQRTETDPVAETLCFLFLEKKKAVILIVMFHCQKLLDS